MKAKKILIVEDDTPLRQALRDKLQKEEFEVIEAKNGEEGLQAAIDQEPDLILLDLIMPKMDGFTMTNKLREYETSQKKKPVNFIPITYLTNVDEEKGLNEGQKLGVYEYLVKSDWSLENIVTRVKNRFKTEETNRKGDNGK